MAFRLNGWKVVLRPKLHDFLSVKWIMHPLAYLISSYFVWMCYAFYIYGRIWYVKTTSDNRKKSVVEKILSNTISNIHKFIASFILYIDLVSVLLLAGFSINEVGGLPYNRHIIYDINETTIQHDLHVQFTTYYIKLLWT